MVNDSKIRSSSISSSNTIQILFAIILHDDTIRSRRTEKGDDKIKIIFSLGNWSDGQYGGIQLRSSTCHPKWFQREKKKNHRIWTRAHTVLSRNGRGVTENKMNYFDSEISQKKNKNKKTRMKYWSSRVGFGCLFIIYFITFWKPAEPKWKKSEVNANTKRHFV